MDRPGNRKFEAGRPRRVDIAAVEAEVRAMWKDAGPAGADQPGTTRACVLNLIIVSERGPDSPDPAIFPPLIAEITAEHPCRVFLVRADPSADASRVEVHVSAHCHLAASGARQVCCEQIALTSSGEAARHLHGSLAPLLVPDLPVFLWWWGEPPFESHRFRGLAGLADRLILDSDLAGRFPAVLTALADWNAAPAEGAARAAPGDLNWRRLTPWRESLAALHDLPAGRRILQEATGVDLRVGGAGGSLGRAFYLAGWLASRLGWELKEGSARRRGDSLEAALDAHGRSVRLTLDRVGGQPGEMNLSLEADAKPHHRQVALEHDPDRQQITVRLEHSGGPSPLAARPLRLTGRAALVIRELEIGSRDGVFEAALATAASLARRWRVSAAGRPASGEPA